MANMLVILCTFWTHPGVLNHINDWDMNIEIVFISIKFWLIMQPYCLLLVAQSTCSTWVLHMYSRQCSSSYALLLVVDFRGNPGDFCTDVLKKKKKTQEHNFICTLCYKIRLGTGSECSFHCCDSCCICRHKEKPFTLTVVPQFFVLSC